LINHHKVLVLAMNGPAVGGGAAWFQGVADIVLASTATWLQCPFSALGLVPEFGSAGNLPPSIGVHRANDILMLGRKITVEELLQWGMVNRVFEHEGFHDQVIQFLEEQLDVNDGKSMLEAKRLMNVPLRRDRLLSLYEAVDAVAERFVEDAPVQRFIEKTRLLQGKYLFLQRRTFTDGSRVS
jgi:peroxisomal 3,2-trans-enoyl-CoA isomerase